MKVLGVVQTQQIVHKYLPLPEKFRKTFGLLPWGFVVVIYGKSGQGKTEMGMQTAKCLCEFGRVLWLSFEQGHGASLQKAINRNRMDEVSGKFLIADPKKNKGRGISFLEDLCDYLDKKNSPDFIFIDSLDYTGWKFADTDHLKTRYPNKGFVYLCQADGHAFRKTVSMDTAFDGEMTVYVEKFIGKVEKNRFEAWEDYIVYEDRARAINPKYFIEKDKESAPKKDDSPAQTGG